MLPAPSTAPEYDEPPPGAAGGCMIRTGTWLYFIVMAFEAAAEGGMRRGWPFRSVRVMTFKALAVSGNVFMYPGMQPDGVTV